MLQQIIVFLIVVACGGAMALQAYRFFRPKPGGKACAGGCCDGAEQKPQPAAAGERTLMISSDDLRARVAARKK